MSLSSAVGIALPGLPIGIPQISLRPPRLLGGGRLAAWLALVGVGIALLLAAGPLAAAKAQQTAVPLQCRLGNGPWQPCSMEVQDVGLHWFLKIGRERIEFRHGGDGAVRMQRGDGAWQPVDSRWQADATLCWDGVCAKGAIPLD